MPVGLTRPKTQLKTKGPPARHKGPRSEHERGLPGYIGVIQVNETLDQLPAILRFHQGARQLLSLCGIVHPLLPYRNQFEFVRFFFATARHERAWRRGGQALWPWHLTGVDSCRRHLKQRAQSRRALRGPRPLAPTRRRHLCAVSGGTGGLWDAQHHGNNRGVRRGSSSARRTRVGGRIHPNAAFVDTRLDQRKQLPA